MSNTILTVVVDRHDAQLRGAVVFGERGERMALTMVIEAIAVAMCSITALQESLATDPELSISPEEFRARVFFRVVELADQRKVMLEKEIR